MSQKSSVVRRRQGAEMQQTCRSLVVAVLAVAWLAGCGADDEEASVSDSAEAVSDVVDAEPRGDLGDPAAVSFVFSGEEGEAGCRYDGPAEIGAEISSTATNETDGAVTITLARLAADASVEDFEEYVRTLGDSYPVLVPPADHQPSAHDWMEGTWLQLHTIPAGESQTVEQSSMFEGDYVAFCFRPSDGEPGSELWPAGTLRVRP